jgi:hypothetical protein
MIRVFNTLDSLFQFMEEDRNWEGAHSTIRNRFPVRFVLFENFADFNEFVNSCPDWIFSCSITDLIEKGQDDLVPTYTELSNKIREQIRLKPTSNYIVYPFSELARFYKADEFSALVKTVSAYQPDAKAQSDKLRIYIPIVGMQGKMGSVIDSPQTFVWEYKSSSEEDMGIYRLIITPETYGVTGLDKDYSIVKDFRHWLDLWRLGGSVKSNIISTSRSIRLKAKNAQPDNAFNYVECNNAFEFLINGLRLDFGSLRFREEELQYWEQLADKIDVENFNFHDFINSHFGAFEIKNGIDFIKIWVDCGSSFDRWLISLYYKSTNANGYVRDVLDNCYSLSNAELFGNIATHILEINATDADISERRDALKEAAFHDIKITDLAEKKLNAKLNALLCGTQEDRYTAISFMTAFTHSERETIVKAYGSGQLSHQDLQRIYPALFHYVSPLAIGLPTENLWIVNYFDAYRQAKMANNADKVLNLLHKKNEKPSTFAAWHDNFKTVKTILHNRPDIDVYYWIDGLGLDWVPFIISIIERYKQEKVYLNEVHVATAILPTTTVVNKPQLESLLPEGQKLDKIGDLDNFAHKRTGKYPSYIIDELQIVEDAISKVLKEYNGKKIAFISDHGMTYTAQYGTGLSLAGVESDHEGRKAIKTNGTPIADNKYLILDDNKTLCSLTEVSLTAKTPSGHGAHGGATPEEVLVPIIIVSPNKNASNFTVNIKNDEVDSTNPVLIFEIRGLSSVDVPTLSYNDVTYTLNNTGGAIYTSERLALTDTANTAIVFINGESFGNFNIKVSTGAQENDLFGDF